MLHVVGNLDRPAVELRHDVTLTDTRLCRRALWIEVRDQQPPGIRQPQRLAKSRGQFLEAHVERSTRHRALPYELRDDLARGIAGEREADAEVVQGQDRGEADHLAPRVDERPADAVQERRRVGLEEIVDPGARARSGRRADDAAGDRRAQAVRRRNGQDPVAHARRVGVTESGTRKRTRPAEPKHGDIRLAIEADDGGLVADAIRHDGLDVCRSRDRVRRGDDETVRVQDHPGAHGLAASLQRSTEELVAGTRPTGCPRPRSRIEHVGHRDGHDGGKGDAGQRREVVRADLSAGGPGQQKQAEERRTRGHHVAHRALRRVSSRHGRMTSAAEAPALTESRLALAPLWDRRSPRGDGRSAGAQQRRARRRARSHGRCGSVETRGLPS